MVPTSNSCYHWLDQDRHWASLFRPAHVVSHVHQKCPSHFEPHLRECEIAMLNFSVKSFRPDMLPDTQRLNHAARSIVQSAYAQQSEPGAGPTKQPVRWICSASDCNVTSLQRHRPKFPQVLQRNPPARARGINFVPRLGHEAGICVASSCAVQQA